MAINSYDDIIAAIAANKWEERHFAKTLPIAPAAGVCVSLWEGDGMPTAGGSGSSLVGRNCTPSVTGSLAFTNAAGADENYLMNAQAWASASGIGSLVIYDRICDISGISLTQSPVAQTITMGPLPRYTDGAGVMIFLEVSASVTGIPTFTVTYTDQSGNSAVTPPVTGAANALGRFAYNSGPYIPLASGDTGVRSVQSFTNSSGASVGIGRLVFAKPLAVLPLLTAGTVVERDLVTQTPRMPLLPDDHCISAFVVGAGTTTGTVYGSLSVVKG
jgi:hypothetical protein